MKFDRNAPGQGVEVRCRLENGKAFLEWEFHIVKMVDDAAIRLLLVDNQGNVAAECVQMLREEEPMQSILLQPHLWSGTKDPYLYHLEAFLTDIDGNCKDRICEQFPLRSVEKRGESGEKELYLNGQRFLPKAVYYSLPASSPAATSLAEASATGQQRLILEDLQQILSLGANCIYMKEAEEPTRLFLQLCEQAGILVCTESCGEKNIAPMFRGEKDALFLPDSKYPTSLFYQYKAKWSQDPFVYIVPESVKPLKSGNYTVRCYSNCDRVALYSDGALFEFQRGDGEFTFYEVPAKAPCIMLTAEGDGCSQSLSLHKTFTKLSRFGDI